MKIGLLGATFETPNLGVSVLAAGALQCIFSCYPDAEIFFLDYAREGSARTVVMKGRESRVELIPMRFSKKVWLGNNIVVLLLAALVLRLVPSQHLRSWLLTRNSCLHTIAEADFFGSVAGGDSFSDIYGLPRLLYVTLPQILVLLLGRRLVLLPQTYGPFRHVLSRAIARRVVARAEIAFCRDRRSLQGFMSQNTGQFCYDMGFAIAAVRPSHLSAAGLELPEQRDSNLAGLNISGLLYQGGYSHKNDFGLRADYHEVIEAVLHRLIRERGMRVLLIPHVYGTEAASESDVLACEAVFQRCQGRYGDKLGILRGTYDPNEIRYVIGLCGFFIGSRMHACIAAMAQQVPAVSIAYSDKFLGVMETVGMGSFAADARRLSREEVLETVDFALDHREELVRVLESTMGEVRDSLDHLLRQHDLSRQAVDLAGAAMATAGRV